MNERLEPRACEYCGKEFKPRHSHNKFCSLKCAVDGRQGIKARNQEVVYCSVCGEKMTRKRSAAKRCRNFYCSPECGRKFYSRVNRGSGNPNFKDAGKKTCRHCGNEFRAYNKSRKYCGLKCAAKAGQKIQSMPLYGLRAEVHCCRELKSRGYHTTRSAGSRGPYDVIAFNDEEILLIQVKRTERLERVLRRDILYELWNAPCPVGVNVYKELWCWLNGTWYIERMAEGATSERAA